MLIKQIKIAITRRKIKRHKKEIELLNYYNEHRDTCTTCEFFEETYDYDHYWMSTITRCLLEFKDVRDKENRSKCQFYKVHKTYRKLKVDK